MRDITFISDTHGSHYDCSKWLGGGFMICHCGDVSSMGHRKEIQGFLKWFGSLPYEHKIFIAGNHDFGLQNYGIKAFAVPEGVTYLENSFVELGGIKIYGSPVIPAFMNWAFMRERGEDIRRVWDCIHDCDVLLTHGPPKGILDFVNNSWTRTNVGCEELRRRILDFNPWIHAFGHIHDCYGKVSTDSTVFINCSVMNEDYDVVNAPVIIDYDKVI